MLQSGDPERLDMLRESIWIGAYELGSSEAMYINGGCGLPNLKTPINSRTAILGISLIQQER